jgi:putative protein kinase ArgK-like GTPase of G3E family
VLAIDYTRYAVTPSAVSLITGVPGIGKSLFLIYFIYRYLRDEKFGKKICIAIRPRGLSLLFSFKYYIYIGI